MTEDVHVIVKLSSGEEVIGIMESEDAKFVKVLFPMTVHYEMYRDDDGAIQKTSKIIPFCQYSNHRIFHLNKQFVVFINPLHQSLIEPYRSLVDAYAIQEAESEPLDTNPPEGNDTVH